MRQRGATRSVDCLVARNNERLATTQFAGKEKPGLGRVFHFSFKPITGLQLLQQLQRDG